MDIVFFGTSKYCLPVLEALKPQLKLVVVMPDRPVGRKQVLTPCATKVWAMANNIPTALSLRAIAKQSFDLGLVADYGRIIPKEEFDIPKLGTFNIHFSKLPDLRGASPVQQTILRGDDTAWITIFNIDETLDTGPILDQRAFPILPDDTTESLYTRLFIEVSKYITTLDFTKKLIPQSGTPTFCKMLTRQDGFVEYSKLLEPRTYNLYRAYYPWPGIWTIKNGKRMKILKCHSDKNKIVIDLLQYEGRKPACRQAGPMIALGRSLLVLFFIFLITPRQVFAVYDKYILEVPRAGIIEEIAPANPFKINDYLPVINNKIAQATGTSKNLIYLFAHSAAFDYNGIKSKPIFATLDYVDEGDTILINHFGDLKKYRITDKIIAAQTNLSFLTQKPTEETLVLQTCLPGSNFDNRLIITAKLVNELAINFSNHPRAFVDETGYHLN